LRSLRILELDEWGPCGLGCNEMVEGVAPVEYRLFAQLRIQFPRLQVSFLGNSRMELGVCRYIFAVIDFYFFLYFFLFLFAFF